jgi:hypothetical protein
LSPKRIQSSSASIFLVLARRIAAVFVLPVQLRVREEPFAVAEVELELRDAELDVMSGVDGLFECVTVAHGDELDRKFESRTEPGVLTVAIVAAELEFRVPEQRALLRAERQRSEHGRRREQTSK